jgi:hypothetical protein
MLFSFVYHLLFVRFSLLPFAQRFPEAAVLYAPGIAEEKRLGARITALKQARPLPTAPGRQEIPGLPADEFESEFIAGNPEMQETCFLHKPSNSVCV